MLFQGVSSLYQMETLIQGGCLQSPFLISGEIMSLRFYNIDSEYLNYLNNYDHRVSLHNSRYKSI